MVGILVSLWEGPFSGAMLVSGRVNHHLGEQFLLFWKSSSNINTKSPIEIGSHPEVNHTFPYILHIWKSSPINHQLKCKKVFGWFLLTTTSDLQIFHERYACLLYSKCWWPVFLDRECISCCHEGIKKKVMTWITGWKMLHLHHWNGNYGGLSTKHIPSGKLTFQWKMDLVKICSLLKNMFLPATPPKFLQQKFAEKWWDWSRRASPFGGMYPPTQRYSPRNSRPYFFSLLTIAWFPLFSLTNQFVQLDC